MEWTRSETLALAMHNCTQCHGCGLRLRNTGGWTPCNCVLRAMFRICHDRFRRCAEQERHLSHVSVEPPAGSYRPMSFGRKDEEYMAEFCLVSRRSLTEPEHLLFRYHFLLGADWTLCTRKLGMNRGNFFHAVYRIEQKLGRVFRELQPYPLFPLDDYFNGPSRFVPGRATAPKCHEIPLRPPHLRFPQPIGNTA
jgi:hypothetical protein